MTKTQLIYIETGRNVKMLVVGEKLMKLLELRGRDVGAKGSIPVGHGVSSLPLSVQPFHSPAKMTTERSPIFATPVGRHLLSARGLLESRVHPRSNSVSREMRYRGGQDSNN